MIKELSKSLLLYCFCCILIIIYCGLLRLSGVLFAKEQADGSLIYDDNNKIRGSRLVMQNYSANKYFRGRKMNSTYNSCNFALYNPSFTKILQNRYIRTSYKDDISMISSSASMLDPYIKKEYAMMQIDRVANERDLDAQIIQDIIEKETLHATWPFFELDIINIQTINAKLDLFEIINN